MKLSQLAIALLDVLLLLTDVGSDWCWDTWDCGLLYDGSGNRFVRLCAGAWIVCRYFLEVWIVCKLGTERRARGRGHVISATWRHSWHGDHGDDGEREDDRKLDCHKNWLLFSSSVYCTFFAREWKLHFGGSTWDETRGTWDAIQRIMCSRGDSGLNRRSQDTNESFGKFPWRVPQSFFSSASFSSSFSFPGNKTNSWRNSTQSIKSYSDTTITSIVDDHSMRNFHFNN